jgi:hypothetical protein
MRYGANLDARNKRGQLPIDMTRNEEIKQAILDEPRRRNDHTYNRIREEDLQPTKQQKVKGEGEEGAAAAAAAAAEEAEEEGEESEGDDDDDDDNE